MTEHPSLIRKSKLHEPLISEDEVTTIAKTALLKAVNQRIVEMAQTPSTLEQILTKLTQLEETVVKLGKNAEIEY